MKKVPSWLSSSFYYTCPRCRVGDLFHKPFSLSSAYGMPDRCGVCGQNYMPEPGFYYGGMFISYILSGWLLVLIALALVFLAGWTITMSLVVVGLIGAMSHTFFFRMGRSIWIHMMVAFRPEVYEEAIRRAQKKVSQK